jgi:hypothetical protein
MKTNNCTKFLDKSALFLLKPANKKFSPSRQKLAWAISIITGILSVGILHAAIAIWRSCHPVKEKNQLQRTTEDVVQRALQHQEQLRETQTLLQPQVPPSENELREYRNRLNQSRAFHRTWKARVEPATRTQANIKFLSQAEHQLKKVETLLQEMEQLLAASSSPGEMTANKERLEAGFKEINISKGLAFINIEDAKIYDPRWYLDPKDRWLGGAL